MAKCDAQPTGSRLMSLEFLLAPHKAMWLLPTTGATARPVTFHYSRALAYRLSMKFSRRADPGYLVVDVRLKTRGRGDCIQPHVVLGCLIFVCMEEVSIATEQMTRCIFDVTTTSSAKGVN